MSRALTPKMRVLSVFPNARCVGWAGPAYCIYPGDVKIVRGRWTRWLNNNSLNVSDKTPRAAWASAAKPFRRRSPDRSTRDAS